MAKAVPTLEDAIALALQVHRGQLDKAGQPYILHPLRVLLRMKSPEDRIAAVLHDVIEDSEHTLETLREMGFPDTVLTALDCLTRRDGESYADFIARAKQNPIARRVKIADLEDNLDVRRLRSVGEKDAERLDRYLVALAALESAPADHRP